MLELAGAPALDRTLLSMLRCPECGAPLAGGEQQAACTSCGACYPHWSGIWRMLTPSQQQEYAGFLAGYSALRLREGWVRSDNYYLSLPDVPPGDPAEHIWRIRRRSLSTLDRLLPPGAASWALDLGAGCGWLSRHLARRGYNTVAVDLNVEGADALEGARVYMEHDHIWLGRVQASMDHLPFADASFALCTVSAALHYAPLVKTLAEVHRVLRQGGMLFVTDSPVYRDAEAGRIMASEQRARASALLDGAPAELLGGEGYLAEGRFVEAMRAAGFRPRVVPTESLGGQARRMLRHWTARGSREHARFPVLAGVKE